MIRLKFILFLLSIPFFTCAQYEHVLHKSYAEKVDDIHAIYKSLYEISDSLKRIEKAEEIKRFAYKHKDPALALNIDFFMTFWNACYMNQPKDAARSALISQLEEYSRNDVDFLKLRSLRALAEFYWKKDKNYELAFEQYLIISRELENTRPEEYPEMVRDLMQIGQSYYFFHDYEVATQYFKRAIELPETPFNTLIMSDARNTMGLCYQNLNLLDSADYYFNQVRITSFPQSQVWKRIATGNIGNSMYLRKKYDEAIPLLEIDFYGSVEENDYGCAAGAATLLADIYRTKGDLKKSWFFIGQALDYIQKIGQPVRLRLLYPIMSKYYAQTGNTALSVQYADSAVAATNRYNERFSALKVLRAQQRVDRKNQELQLAAMVLERQQKVAERNLLVLLILILLAVTVLTYYVQKKRQLDKDLKLQQATRELELAELKLNQFTESILEKNRLIDQLKSSAHNGEKSEVLRELQQSTILTEADWVAYQQLFDRAYPGFIQRVREKLPELSMGEIRYVVLRRLNLTNKEMASMLGVSPNAVQVMRHRILRKLNLPDNTGLEEVIRNT